MGFLRRLLGRAPATAPAGALDYLSAFRLMVLTDQSGELFDCSRGSSHIHNTRLVTVRVLSRDADVSDERLSGMPIGIPGGPSPWTEFWTLDVCGELRSFYISFEPTEVEGTRITTRRASGNPTLPRG